MGVYGSDPGMNFYGRPRPPMDGGAVTRGLADRFSSLGVGDSSNPNESLDQVRQAVEDAGNTIKQQKLGALSPRPSGDVSRYNHTVGPYNRYLSNSPVGTEAGRSRWMDNGSSMNAQGTLIIHQNGIPESDDPSSQIRTGNQNYSESGKVNGTMKVFPGGQIGLDSAGLSQFSTPSSRSPSPSRQRREGEYGPRFNLPGHGLIPVPEINSNTLWKQDLIIKVREHEDHISQLKRHLADYSVKEAQIRNEKYILEKRIAYMRVAFDQQQQDLVDAASKALSYRQDIIEENIRLQYALQAVQQERSTFTSSLLPLLSEYALQPSVLDAPSIVSNLKVLFKHLQEKLIISEEKLEESQYQLAPWRTESSKDTSFPLQPLPHSLGAALATSNSNSLEIVPQPTYSHAQSPSFLNAHSRGDLEALGNQNRNFDPTEVPTRNLDHDNMQRSSATVSRNAGSQDSATRPNQSDSHVRFSAETKNQHTSFKDLVKGNEMDDNEAAGFPPGREPSVHWASGGSPYTSGLDDPNSSYPYLPPVLEEPSSSFSEAAEDDPLPAIEALQISGEAFPGRELQASGYSINGTTSCNFEWVRYLEDGSVNYIEGAKQPKYLVTADDVDSYLAIEIQPLDDNKRKGELVKVFANEQRKITCDPEMQEQIERTLYVGHVSYEVSLSARFLDIWEHAILAIKREGYSVKCSGPRGVVVTEKFSQATTITIPYGHPSEFIIQCASGVECVLKTTDSSSLRDSIVLTMRLFKMRAVEKRKGRKKVLFFK